MTNPLQTKYHGLPIPWLTRAMRQSGLFAWIFCLIGAILTLGGRIPRAFGMAVDQNALSMTSISSHQARLPADLNLTDMPENSFLFGVVNDNGDHYPDEWSRGIRATVFELSWNYYEPQPGVFDNAYISHMQEILRNLKSQGWYVQLVPGLQYTPGWVFANYPNMRFVNQYGDTYSPDPNTQRDFQVINAPFNPQARSLQAAYLARIFQDFNQADPGLRFDAIRIGGGVQGELRYPPPLWNGHTNSYWAFDGYAQNTSASGIPSTCVGWRPAIDPNPGSVGRGQLIVNPGFEITDNYFPVLGWTWDNQVSAALTTSTPHSGSRALQVTIGLPGRVHQYVRVTPNTAYTISGWVKSSTSLNSARIFLTQYQNQTQPTADAPLKLESFSTAWTNVQASITTGPNAHFIKAELDGNAPGVFYFDDLALKPAGVTNNQQRDLNTPLAFFNWYVKSMTNYQNWQIDQVRKYFSGEVDLVFAGKGALPKLVMDALTNDLQGDGWSEGNSALYSAALYDRHVAGLASKSKTALYLTGIEGMPPDTVNDGSSYPIDWSAARWISYLAKNNGLAVWGENGGGNNLAQLQLTLQRARDNRFLGIMWVVESELYGGNTAYASIDQYTTQIKQYKPYSYVFVPFVGKK